MTEKSSVKALTGMRNPAATDDCVASRFASEALSFDTSAIIGAVL